MCVYRFYFDLIVHCKLNIYLLLTCDDFNSILSGFIICICMCVCIVAFANQTLSAASLPDKQNCVNGLPIERSQLRTAEPKAVAGAAAVAAQQQWGVLIECEVG